MFWPKLNSDYLNSQGCCLGNIPGCVKDQIFKQSCQRRCCIILSAFQANKIIIFVFCLLIPLQKNACFREISVRQIQDSVRVEVPSLNQKVKLFIQNPSLFRKFILDSEVSCPILPCKSNSSLNCFVIKRSIALDRSIGVKFQARIIVYSMIIMHCNLASGGDFSIDTGFISKREPEFGLDRTY